MRWLWLCVMCYDIAVRVCDNMHIIVCSIFVNYANHLPIVFIFYALQSEVLNVVLLTHVDMAFIG